MSVKSDVRNLLMDSSIINLTADKKVYFLHAENPTPNYIEYEFYDENGNAYSEGEEIATNFYLQVDIFSKGNYGTLENAIKKKLIDNGFERLSAVDLYEDGTKLFHCAMRFILTK